MLEILVEHLGAVQFEMKTRGHSVVSDQPADKGGFDEGMTPPELLLASLGSCAGFYAVDYLKRQNIAAEGTKVRVTAEKAKNPARLDDFKIEVEVAVGLSEEHHKGLVDAVNRCLIHNTLTHPPKIELAVKGAAIVAG
jgi:uncharacterized OsmC-like protein